MLNILPCWIGMSSIRIGLLSSSWAQGVNRKNLVLCLSLFRSWAEVGICDPMLLLSLTRMLYIDKTKILGHIAGRNERMMK